MATTEASYRGEEGDAYLSQREGARSDHVQTLRASLFRDLGGPNRTVLDFGCGAGGVVSRIEAKRRLGIEIGEAAAELARAQGIEVFSRLEDVPDQSVDVVISFHALEHVERPLDMLREIGRVVRRDGTIRLIVPGELATDPAQAAWRPNHDRHLFTWTPLLFGNLAFQCGYEAIRTRLEPMPTGSRLVRALAPIPALSRAAHWRLSKRQNALNVILDAKPPQAAPR